MVLKVAENRRHTGMILIDLQKAFDTLDHKILLNKTTYISFLDKAIKSFHFYLTTKTFFVSLDNVFLEAETAEIFKNLY